MFQAPFDSSSVDNMRRLVEHSGAPGHIYPMSLLCYDIMPPPAQVLLLCLSSLFWDSSGLLSSHRLVVKLSRLKKKLERNG